MKSLLKGILMVTVLTVAFIACTPAIKASAQDDYVSYQTFYDDLSPYGEWVYDPQYGYVWVPDVGSDFRPYYTNGYWAATNYGNMWVSSYPWGWAAFHYGRWTYDPYYGWVWIPGTEWGPAWVNWRYGGGYYGWAPLGPGVTISMSFGNYYCPNDWWVFVGPNYLYRHDFYRYWRGPRYNTTIINNTYIINNHYNNRYVYGPRPDDIQRATHQRVNVYNVNSGHRPGPAQVSSNALTVFRPTVRANSGNGGRPEPSRALRAPRAISEKPQSVSSGRPEFHTAVRNNQVQPLERGNTQRPQPNIRQQNTSRQMPVQQQVQPRQLERNMPRNDQRFDARPQQTQPRVERQPVQQQPDRRFDNRPQPQQDRRFDNRPLTQPQPQRVEPTRQQPQQQRFESRPQPQQQRFESRPQPQQQRFESRPQPQQQRFESRPQPQQQRFESRPQPQQQRFESRPQPMQQPRPQPMQAPRQENNGRGNGRR